jgi:hypothetical protein
MDWETSLRLCGAKAAAATIFRGARRPAKKA